MANTTAFTTAMEEPLTASALLGAYPPNSSTAAQEHHQQQQQQQLNQESAIKYINTQAEHSQATSHAENTNTPTVLYVSYSPAPTCKAFTPKFEMLAHAYTHSSSTDTREREIVWCQMEYDKETSPMMKFGPQHCPILVLLKGPKCRTILGGDIKALENAVRADFLS